MEAHDARRAIRIGSWIVRFVCNCRKKKRCPAPLVLTTEEIQQHSNWWIQRVQDRVKQDPHYESDRLQLNLQLNGEGILECRGCLQGHYPIYLPDSAPFTKKFVQRTHVETLHGGVSLTMTILREIYWIPRLRQLVKATIRQCWGCKRFQAVAVKTPPPGLLPTTRTELNSRN